MTGWKTYLLFATILPLVQTKDSQKAHGLETTTISKSPQLYGHGEMSEEHKIEVGNRIEPVIFEPQRKIRLSRSTYKVTSYVDFKPYKQAFKQFGQYMGRCLVDLRDPHYISTLYNAGRHEDDPLIRRGAGVKTVFTEITCRESTYKCRVQNQFIQLKKEAIKINQIYLETYKKFLKAIDHMEFHPALGRTKTESTIRLKRQPHDNNHTEETSQWADQIKGLTGENDVKTS